MRMGSLGVTFFSICPSVRIYVRKVWEIQFGMPGMAGYGPDHPQTPQCPSSGLEVDTFVLLSVCTSLTSLTNLMRGIYIQAQGACALRFLYNRLASTLTLTFTFTFWSVKLGLKGRLIFSWKNEYAIF